MANGADMKRWLSKLNNNNAQVNTTSPTSLRWRTREGREIAAVHPARISEVEGVNNRAAASARLERVYSPEQAEKLRWPA